MDDARNESESDLRREVENVSPWAPLSNPVYRSFWIASLVSNLGTWMHEIGAGWLMTDLDASPQMVAAVRAAMASPIVLLAIPVGALADRIDRRRLLLFTQFLMFTTTASLAAMTAIGIVTSWSLLAMTFVIGIGLTLHVPTWQASVPELVPKEQLSRAIALGSVSFNLARAAGPALAGVLVALTGSWIAFSFNAFSFAAVIVVVFLWRRERRESSRGQSYLLSLVHGLRYVSRNREMRNTLIRLAMFVLPASSFWCLLPLVARRRLGLEADGFGVLVTCFGVGAVVAARLMPRFHAAIGMGRTTSLSTLGFSLGLLVMATTTNGALVKCATVLMGGGWMITLTTLNTSAQVSLHGRMRARGMSCYLTSMAASMSVGSLLWGRVADQFGVAETHQVAVVLLIVSALVGTTLHIGAESGRRAVELTGRRRVDR